MHNLASFLGNQGRLAEAEILMNQTLLLRGEVFGPDHLQTLYTKNGFATLLGQQGRNEEAERLMREVVAVRERVLGPDHAATLLSVQNLANCLIQQGKLQEAEPLARRAYDGMPRAMGPEHPRVRVATNSVGFLMEDLGQLDEAEKYYRAAVDFVRKSKGMANPESFGPTNKRGELADAEKIFADLITAAIAAMGPEHFYIAIFRNNHGECLTKMKRYDEAEKELLESELLLETTFGVKHARTKMAFECLATLCDAEGEGDDAAKWRERIAADGTTP